MSLPTPHTLGLKGGHVLFLVRLFATTVPTKFHSLKFCVSQPQFSLFSISHPTLNTFNIFCHVILFTYFSQIFVSDLSELFLPFTIPPFFSPCCSMFVIFPSNHFSFSVPNLFPEFAHGCTYFPRLFQHFSLHLILPQIYIFLFFLQSSQIIVFMTVNL